MPWSQCRAFFCRALGKGRDVSELCSHLTLAGLPCSSASCTQGELAGFASHVYRWMGQRQLGATRLEASRANFSCSPSCFAFPRPHFLSHCLSTVPVLSPSLPISPRSLLCFSPLLLSLHHSPMLSPTLLPAPTIFILLLPHLLSLLSLHRAPPRPLSAAGYRFALQTPAALFFLRRGKCFRSAVEISGAAEQRDLSF